jgi:hypothetical protein
MTMTSIMLVMRSIGETIIRTFRQYIVVVYDFKSLIAYKALIKL